MTDEQLKAEAQSALDAAFVQFPAGCDSEQMKEFLKKYNKRVWQLSYAMAMGWETEVARLIKVYKARQ